MNCFFNNYEQITYDKMKPLCEENNTYVFSKVRLIDALASARHGMSDKERLFALRAHLDFLVVGGNHPLFAVEFDGPYHNSNVQKRRDMIKNNLCNRFSLPLLRVDDRHLDSRYRGLDLLTYFMESWFRRTAFIEAQDSGLVHSDESFDPSFILYDGESNNRWPYWLSIDAQIAIQQMHTQGLLYDPVISHWIGTDSDENYHCIAWIRMADHRVVYVRNKMRAQRFPVDHSDLLHQLAIVRLHSLIQQVTSGRANAKPQSVLAQLLKVYNTKYQMRECISYAARTTEPTKPPSFNVQ